MRMSFTCSKCWWEVKIYSKQNLGFLAKQSKYWMSFGIGYPFTERRQRKFSTRVWVSVYGTRSANPLPTASSVSLTNYQKSVSHHYCQSLSFIVSSLLRVAVALSFGLQWRHRSLLKSTSKKSRRLAVITVLWYTAEAVLPSCFAWRMLSLAVSVFREKIVMKRQSEGNIESRHIFVFISCDFSVAQCIISTHWTFFVLFL